MKYDEPVKDSTNGKHHWMQYPDYFFFFDPLSGVVTMDEGFEFLESDLFLFSGIASAFFFFFIFAIVILNECRYQDEIVMRRSLNERHSKHLK